MNEMLLTSEAASALGTTPSNLLAAIRNRRIAAPAALRGNCFFWTKEEVEAARQLLTIDRRRRKVLPIPETRGQCHQPTRFA